jgi:hypothetical protein
VFTIPWPTLIFIGNSLIFNKKTMTQQEYLQLLKNSKGFHALYETEQKRVREAKGEQMERYAAIYLKEQTLRKENARDFIEKVNGAVKEYKTYTKKEERSLQKKTEKIEKNEEMAKQEKILETI